MQSHLHCPEAVHVIVGAGARAVASAVPCCKPYKRRSTQGGCLLPCGLVANIWRALHGAVAEAAECRPNEAYHNLCSSCS